MSLLKEMKPLLYNLPDGHSTGAHRWRSGTGMGCERGKWCGMGCP